MGKQCRTLRELVVEPLIVVFPDFTAATLNPASSGSPHGYSPYLVRAVALGIKLKQRNSNGVNGEGHQFHQQEVETRTPRGGSLESLDELYAHQFRGTRNLI
jgi:hypothetical protein